MMPRFISILPLLLILSACAGDPKVGTIGYPERITEAAVSPQSPIDDARPSGSADSTLSRLRAALSGYRRIEATGGWPILAAGPKLELGAQGERVRILRQRLAASGDLAAEAFNFGTFDESLAIAVSRFQARHGLTTDGVVGPKTLAALNVPVAERIASIRLNQDRVAKEGRDWGQRYIVVNVAAASYMVIEDGRAVLEGSAIVGKPTWPTPRLASIVRQLEFNPFWNVPPRIARLEVWPKIRRDAGYLKRNNMRVIDGQIRQDPGLGNPLGVIKFIFDNPYEVYLHDTNDRSLFERSNRFLSHGCARVSNAIELAKQLLKMDPNWPEQRIDEAVESGRNIRIDLLRSIPVHIVYDTMWIDGAGIAQFRDDVYGLDRKALAGRQAGPDAGSSSCAG